MMMKFGLGKFGASVVAGLALSGCSAGTDQPQAEDGADKIECALGKGAVFAANCMVERTALDGKNLLIVRHPDGGFRRFEQLADGRGLIEADGADQVNRNLEGGKLEISVGNDRYIFSAQEKATSAGANAGG